MYKKLILNERDTFEPEPTWWDNFIDDKVDPEFNLEYPQGHDNIDNVEEFEKMFLNRKLNEFDASIWPPEAEAGDTVYVIFNSKFGYTEFMLRFG